jgi:transposase
LSSELIVKDIRRATPKQYSAEEKIRIVLDGLRGEHSIAVLCRRKGIAESLYYTWSRTSWRPANVALRATPAARSRTCAGKPGR